MNTVHSRPRKWSRILTIATLAAVTCIATGLLSRSWWQPYADPLLASARRAFSSQEHESHDDSHAGCDHDSHDTGVHDQAAHDDPHSECSHDTQPQCDHSACDEHDHAAESQSICAADTSLVSLHLSEQAEKNIDLKPLKIELRDFDRTITVPAMVTERPGRTRIKVSAPMTGIITRIYPISGEAVKPGDPIAEIRMTHEDLVATQSEFLRTVEELDVITREVARLEKVTSSGAVAGKALLERQYEQQKTEAMLHAQKQALMLHGLAQEQVDKIAETRKLLQAVTVYAPQPTDPATDAEPMLQVTDVAVELGQQLNAGEAICVLSDHEELYIEGRAFEEDAPVLNEAANRKTPISALVQVAGKRPQTISDLKILYIENEVERESRALRFFVRLPNELVRNEQTDDGHRFVGWRYKPGQRVELLLPVETWKQRVVLPREAVVGDGVDWFVFQLDGDHYDRRPVHVEYHDQHWAVIGDETALAAGDVVAAVGAYQMHQAVKSQAAGPGDENEHVGCTH